MKEETKGLLISYILICIMIIIIVIWAAILISQWK